MLQLLHIENIAVIEQADIELEQGLTVMSGETGAGKSIVIDSVGAILGYRVSRDLIRSGAKKGFVSAVFTELSPGLTALLAPVAEYLAELIEELGSQRVYLEGASKLLRFPEYHDTKKAQTLLDYMDDNNHLLPIQRQIDGVQIFIGPENGQNPLSETSTIYAKYDIGTVGQGVIGIVGPTRMDYAALSAKLSRFAKGLNQLIAETFLDEKE